MQVALNETGALLASALAHDGWLDGFTRKGGKKAAPNGIWTIPYPWKARPDDGQAFAIVGYDEDGFIVQNSWGNGWGTRASRSSPTKTGSSTATTAGWRNWAWSRAGMTCRQSAGQRSPAPGSARRQRAPRSARAVAVRRQYRPQRRAVAFRRVPHDLSGSRGAGQPPAAGQARGMEHRARGAYRRRDLRARRSHRRAGQCLGRSGGRHCPGRGQEHLQEMKEKGRLITYNTAGRGGGMQLMELLAPQRPTIRLHLVGHSAGAIVHAYLAD